MEKEYQTITEEELRTKLERHKEWLESQGETGAQADFRGADLSGADLSGADLSGADLSAADLNGANLSWAYLREADFSLAFLREADLSGAVLHGTILGWTNLSKTKVNELTLNSARRLEGARVGVNGIWAEGRDTAALMPMTPPGDSMQGGNAEAVVESLKHARQLHTFSFVLVLLGLVIIYLGREKVWIPFPGLNPELNPELMVPVEVFALLAMTFSMGFLALVGTFMDDALAGARYLQTRRDAQTVGTFPWALSRYTGRRSKSQTETWFTRAARKARTALSFIVRFVMAFHPMAYLLLLWDRGGLVPWYYWVLGILLLGFCIRIFWISQLFQKPIVFDGPTEQKRKSDTEELTLVVESLDEKMGALDEKLGALVEERSAE